MSRPRLTRLTRNRHITMALGTGAMALITAIFFIGAPPLPAAAGVGIAVAWLVWRAPAA